jgi:hypothetical protein
LSLGQPFFLFLFVALDAAVRNRRR